MELLTSKHLSTYRDGGEAIYIAIQGEIFDVTESRHLYGKGERNILLRLNLM